MQSSNDSQQPVDRVAAGVKTALFVCVIGFIALMANRSLVAPGGASPIDAPAVPSMIAPDARTPTTLPADDAAIAKLPAPSDDAKSVQFDGGDNHPPSF